MSINVTVNGNPVCVRRSKMVLTDVEQIKKNERDRRRRLRLEQVRQQSKEISCKLLERAKNLAKKQLDKLEKNGKSEIRKMHDRKIMEIQRKYEEDMQDIGLAHSAAALQPDADVIIEIDRRNNRAAAAERGKEAMQRLKESSQREDPVTVQQERLRQVREVENVRSTMVAKLPNRARTSTSKDNDDETNSSQEEEIIVTKGNRVSPKKKKHKKVVGKKSPAKVVSKSNVKIVGHQQKPKSPRRIVVELHRSNHKSPKQTASRARRINGLSENSTETKNASQVTSEVTEVECTNSRCNRETNDQEPRKIIPTTRLTPTKADKVARYNPEDYKPKTSDSNSSSSSSVSEDSSYFSDNGGKSYLPKSSMKQQTSMASSKVQLYDHCTRQRNAYEQPIGLVERTNMRNEPNAVDAAREVIEAEKLAESLLESRRLAAQRRDQDAQLRERVRRDFEAMLKIDDGVNSNERSAKSSRCCANRCVTEPRRSETDRRATEPNVEIILHDSAPPMHSTRDDVPQTRICRETTSQEDRAEEMSRGEHILEVLKKIERQKRLLLREFGADLPNTILSASMTPLFDNRPSDLQAPRTVEPSIEPQQSPEIKIINMSSSDENAKRTKTTKKKSKNKAKIPPITLKTSEIAVQTSRIDEIVGAEDKSIQVSIISDEGRASRSRNETSEILEYVEPRVTVITPEVHESSSDSSIARIPGIVIELENQQVKVTPRKRSTEKGSKRESSRARSKPRSLPSSVPGSPIKRCATSAPSSRSGSPKKSDPRRDSRSPENIINIVVDKASLRVKGSSRIVKLQDTSCETSSPPHSTPEVVDSSVSKPYRVFRNPTFKVVRENRDNSDTSTSYASLPAPMRTNVQSTRHRITPILEMLDSSANESMRPMRRNVSPVSTPETPSASIINVTSNIPRPERIGRILRYENSRSVINGDDSTLPTSTQNSSSTDPSCSRTTHDRRSSSTTRNVESRGNVSNYCTCSNPTCRLLHDNINVIRNYANNDHPEVLDKYDDLQNVCAERIASLTELIKRVRNEQQGMEFSVTSPADETSLMQIPPSRPVRSDFQSVQRLVESIEAIHSKLARTLLESQKIITNGATTSSQQPQVAGNEIAGSSPSYDTNTKGSASTSTEETAAPKSKPIVIANEPVQIDLERLKRGRGPYTAMIVATENPPWPAPGTPRRHEEIVAKLYQEILEQSKTVDSSREKNSASGDCDGSLSRQRTPSPPINLAKKINEDEVTKDERRNPEPKKDEGFVPLLAGIPKIPRSMPNVQSGTRPRPPPAGGPYCSEIISPRHELSTIVEFDTPDTANRSQMSARSANGKSRRPLQLQSPEKSSSSRDRSPMERNAKTQTKSTKPSVHVAPLISENMSRTIPRRLITRDVGSPDEKLVFQDVNDNSMSNGATKKSLLSQGPRGSLENGTARGENDDNSGKRLIEEKGEIEGRDEQEDNVSKGGSCETADDKVVTSILNADSGVGNENKNDKLTSTSSNSFSGLSGISEIASTPTSELVKWASSSEEIETALKKMGLGWAIATLKKTREASALSSSSNSDVTPLNTARRNKSPSKKSIDDCNLCCLPDFSDVSSISIKEASKSTERAVLMKARTSTPNIIITNSSSDKSTSATTSSSGISVQDHSDSLTAPNLSLTKR